MEYKYSDQDPIDIYDLKTENTNFYEIHLYDIIIQKIRHDILKNVKNFKVYYLVKFLKKNIIDNGYNCINVDSEMEIYLIKEQERIIKLKVACLFIMCFKKSLSNYLFDLKNNNNLIDLEIRMGIFDILLLNDFPVNKEINKIDNIYFMK